jgi:hypothetical protein
MDAPHQKFRQQHEKESAHEQQQGSVERQNMREWNSPEELLRHDAGNTATPAAIESRLKVSTASIPAPVRPWWKRWFGS